MFVHFVNNLLDLALLWSGIRFAGESWLRLVVARTPSRRGRDLIGNLYVRVQSGHWRFSTANGQHFRVAGLRPRKLNGTRNTRVRRFAVEPIGILAKFRMI
jgi:hypothetical protein